MKHFWCHGRVLLKTISLPLTKEDSSILSIQLAGHCSVAVAVIWLLIMEPAARCALPPKAIKRVAGNYGIAF